MKYEVVSTGSKGNAVVINSSILIDCGVPFRALKDIYKGLKLVLLTHIHSDHFNKTTLRTLARERPTLRFGCCEWLVKPLVDCGVNKSNIDVLTADVEVRYNNLFRVEPFALAHDVPNVGYKILFGLERVFYATDTAHLNGIEAKGYDLYLIEANHSKEEIDQKIYNKNKAGEYAYERRARDTHLSREAADDFIYRNIGANGEYVYLHAHQDEGEGL